MDMITPTDGTFTFQCSAECVNGDCIPPGLCACNAGWRGKLCDTGIVDYNYTLARCITLAIFYAIVLVL